MGNHTGSSDQMRPMPLVISSSFPDVSWVKPYQFLIGTERETVGIIVALGTPQAGFVSS